MTGPRASCVRRGTRGGTDLVMMRPVAEWAVDYLTFAMRKPAAVRRKLSPPRHDASIGEPMRVPAGTADVASGTFASSGADYAWGGAAGVVRSEGTRWKR